MGEGLLADIGYSKKIERHPDKRPSDSDSCPGTLRGKTAWALKIYHGGALLITEKGLACFSEDELKFDKV